MKRKASRKRNGEQKLRSKRKGKEGFHRKPSGTSLSSKKFRRGD